MVDTDAHSGMVLLTDIKERHQFGFNLLQFLGIFGIGIFQVLERATWVDIVAGIDAHLLTILGSDIGGMGGEMDIGHERGGIAIGLQAGRDILHVFRLTGALSGETHQLATGIDDALGLCHTALGIIGIGGSHGLDADGVVATYLYIAYVTNRTNSSCTHTSLLLSLSILALRPFL